MDDPFMDKPMEILYYSDLIGEREREKRHRRRVTNYRFDLTTIEGRNNNRTLSVRLMKEGETVLKVRRINRIDINISGYCRYGIHRLLLSLHSFD